MVSPGSLWFYSNSKRLGTLEVGGLPNEDDSTKKITTEKDTSLGPFNISGASSGTSGEPGRVTLQFRTKPIFTSTPHHSLTGCNTDFWDVSRKVHTAEFLSDNDNEVLMGRGVQREGRPYGKMGKAQIGTNATYADDGSSFLHPGCHQTICSLKLGLF